MLVLVLADLLMFGFTIQRFNPTYPAAAPLLSLFGTLFRMASVSLLFAPGANVSKEASGQSLQIFTLTLSLLAVLNGFGGLYPFLIWASFSLAAKLI